MILLFYSHKESELKNSQSYHKRQKYIYKRISYFFAPIHIYSTKNDNKSTVHCHSYEYVLEKYCGRTRSTSKKVSLKEIQD